MTIKPDKAYTVLWFCALISIPLVIYFFRDRQFELVFLLCCAVGMLIVTFTKAFSSYTLDYRKIKQKCGLCSRAFEWGAFKYIGVQRLVRGGGLGATPSYYIRCSTVALPKSMTKDEFDKKLYWRPSKTITIPLQDKDGNEIYQKFLSYCGGERDIRD